MTWHMLNGTVLPKEKTTKSARRFPTKQKISKQNTQIFKMPKYSKYVKI